MAKKYYYKGSTILAPYTITSNEPHFDMTTVSLRTQRASQGHQRWELGFSLLNTASEEADVLLGMLTDFDSVNTMIMPQLPSVAARFSVNTSSPLTLSQTTFIDVTTVIVNTIGATGVLPKGSFISFSNHDKIYITTTELDLNQGLSAMSLGIYPSLRSFVNTSATINLMDDVDFLHYRDIDTSQGISFTDGILSNPGTISLREAL